MRKNDTRWKGAGDFFWFCRDSSVLDRGPIGGIRACALDASERSAMRVQLSATEPRSAAGRREASLRMNDERYSWREGNALVSASWVPHSQVAKLHPTTTGLSLERIAGRGRRRDEERREEERGRERGRKNERASGDKRRESNGKERHIGGWFSHRGTTSPEKGTCEPSSAGDLQICSPREYRYRFQSACLLAPRARLLWSAKRIVIIWSAAFFSVFELRNY